VAPRAEQQGDDVQIDDAVVAEREIRRRLLDYCRGIDRCDADLVASVYHPDATDDHGGFSGSGIDFARYATEKLREHAEATMHVIGDSLIDFTSDTTADVETPVLAWHRCRDDDGPYLERFGGRYFDTFERRDGAWKITHRLVTHDWDAKERVTPAFPPARFTPSPRRTPGN
jgi:ketosteroid isomerase-like protein